MVVFAQKAADLFTKIVGAFNSATWELLIIFGVLAVIAGLILAFPKARRRINWKFALIFLILYFEIVFIDFGSSTPYALDSCNGAAHETNTLLSNLLSRNVGWVSFPIMIVFNSLLGFSFLIVSNFTSKLPQSLYTQGFIMGIIFVFICLIFAIHIDASVNNYTLCT